MLQIYKVVAGSCTPAKYFMSSVQFPYKKIAHVLLAGLPSKTRDVLYRRFGLHGKRQTLQEIGDHYGITRERVRQIEDFGLKTIRANQATLSAHREVFASLHDHMKKYGDVRREDLLLKEAGGPFEPH